MLALSTSRAGGVSQPPFDSLNLGAHCGDDPVAVAENRQRLHVQAGLPSEPVWLSQVHGTKVVDAATVTGTVEADASFTTQPGVVCGVLTADCLPILICDRAGTCVAAIHAGWRGLAGGVIEATIAALPARQSGLMAWLGPAIGPLAYEVGVEVREAFVAQHADAVTCFKPVRPGHHLADLYGLARERLLALSVRQVFGGDQCTHNDSRLFSYRRDRQTGRQATLIWLSTAAAGNHLSA